MHRNALIFDERFPKQIRLIALATCQHLHYLLA